MVILYRSFSTAHGPFQPKRAAQKHTKFVCNIKKIDFSNSV
jgi:hypothetical protein